MPSTKPSQRYENVSEQKSSGATYTPKVLADFVAAQIVGSMPGLKNKETVRILEPSIGDGELIISLLECLEGLSVRNIVLHAFDINEEAILNATKRVRDSFPNVDIKILKTDFLEFVLRAHSGEGLFQAQSTEKYDLVIANPPYVRTQVMGATQAQEISKQFGLSGRIDLYHAFLIGINRVMAEGGVAGVIVSNRFMSTKSGTTIRQFLKESFSINHIWDFGDTKLFEAAVLPAVLLLKKSQTKGNERFTSIYTTKENSSKKAENIIHALSCDGVVEVGESFYEVRHGSLNTKGSSTEVWRVSNSKADDWLAQIEERTWKKFRDIGKTRVGVKTCADKVFIRSNWDLMGEKKPELLRPLITHHIARSFKAGANKNTEILYPHTSVQGVRMAVDIAAYPNSQAYLEENRTTLEARTYVIEAGRKWFEIWVPQDPASWDLPKMVFRDISEKPCFWLDFEKGVVNGDCYWMSCGDNLEHLWLACAVANSSFIEEFYDRRFNNKLYAGRRRFITQYVEEFPLPDPDSDISKKIVELAKKIYATVDTDEVDKLTKTLDNLIWNAFGFFLEEVSR